LFVNHDKPEKSFLDLDLSTTTGDHPYIKASARFFSVAVRGGGGAVIVRRLDQPGKISSSEPKLAGHKAAVTDTEWNPFNDNVLYTASDDATVKIWQIPEGGLTENLTEAAGSLDGHIKTVTLLRAHPVASNVLASAGKKPCVKIWDVEKCDDKLTLEDFGGFVQDLNWNYNGSLLATTSKDKLTRVWDPRSSKVVASHKCHDGAKASKVLFLGRKEQLVTVGFTRQSKREFKGWDPRKLDTPLFHKELDQSAGVLLPFYDESNNILYLGGKGDGNMRFFEFVNESPFVYTLGEDRTTTSAKGLCMVPKRTVDVNHSELMRFLKLTPNTVTGFSVMLPRKAEGYDPSIYPDIPAAVPAQSAEKWFAGTDVDPKLQSMDPSQNPDAPVAAALTLDPVVKAQAPAPAAAAAGSGGAGSSSAEDLQKQLDEALKKLAALEIENKELKEQVAELKK
ncbi:corA, partial [Symbiodinium sp. KB8]